MEVGGLCCSVVTLAYPSSHPSDRTVQYRSITGPRVNYNSSSSSPCLTGFHSPARPLLLPLRSGRVLMWESLTRTAANCATKHPSRGINDSDEDRPSRMPWSVSINLCNNNFISHTDCRHRDPSGPQSIVLNS